MDKNVLSRAIRNCNETKIYSSRMNKLCYFSIVDTNTMRRSKLELHTKMNLKNILNERTYTKNKCIFFLCIVQNQAKLIYATTSQKSEFSLEGCSDLEGFGENFWVPVVLCFLGLVLVTSTFSS